MTNTTDQRLPGERRWRYSKKRLDELERILKDIEAEASALDIGGPNAEAPRFACAADRDRYTALERQWKHVYNERDLCRMAVGRRNNRRKYGTNLGYPI